MRSFSRAAPGPGRRRQRARGVGGFRAAATGGGGPWAAAKAGMAAHLAQRERALPRARPGEARVVALDCERQRGRGRAAARARPSRARPSRRRRRRGALRSRTSPWRGFTRGRGCWRGGLDGPGGRRARGPRAPRGAGGRRDAGGRGQAGAGRLYAPCHAILALSTRFEAVGAPPRRGAALVGAAPGKKVKPCSLVKHSRRPIARLCEWSLGISRNQAADGGARSQISLSTATSHFFRLLDQDKGERGSRAGWARSASRRLAA